MNRLSIIFALVFCFLTGAAIAAPQEKFIIRPLKHPELAESHIYAVAGSAGMRVWALQHRLLVENEDGTTMIFDRDNSPIAEEGTIADVAIANDEIWVAQTAPSKGLGLFKFSSSNWETFRDPDAPGLLNNDIVDIHVDKDETLWFGHRFHGLSRYLERVNPTFQSYNKIIHLYDNSLLTSFMQLTHLWIGTVNGIIRLRTELKSNHDLNVDKWLYPEFPAREAFSICDYKNDLIIAGTSRGLALFDGEKWSIRRANEGILALPALHLARSGDSVWIGSPVGLQLWNDNKPGMLLTEKDGLPSANITALCLDENNNLLIGTEKGAAILGITPAEQK